MVFVKVRMRLCPPTPPKMLVCKGSTDNEPDCYRGPWVDVCAPALEPIREGVVEVALIPLGTT